MIVASFGQIATETGHDHAVLMGTWQATANAVQGCEPLVKTAGLPAGSMPASSLAGDAFVETGRIWRVQLVPVIPGDARDLIPDVRSGAPVPAADRATRRAACPETVVRGGMGGRGLSHLQEQPLTSTRSRRAPGKTGACGQLGSRTADRMAVPVSPSIRERACPARLRPARTMTSREETDHIRRKGWMCTAGSTGPKTTTTSPWPAGTGSC